MKTEEYTYLEKRMIEEINKRNEMFNMKRFSPPKHLLKSSPSTDVNNIYSTYLIKTKQLKNSKLYRNGRVFLYCGQYLRIIKNYERYKYYMSKEKKKLLKLLKVVLPSGVLVEKLSTKNKNLHIYDEGKEVTIWKSYVNPTDKTEFVKGTLKFGNKI